MKKKQSAVSGQSSEKAVTIIVTVLPPKKGGRKMLVSAARDGEMPLVLSGLFADRHHLLDQAYATALKREAQVVTIKEGKQDKRKGGQEGEKVVADVDTARDGDQLVGSTEALSDAGEGTEEELPAIEGDEGPSDAGQIMQVMGPGSTEALTEDEDTDGFQTTALGDDGGDDGADEAEVNRGEQD